MSFKKLIITLLGFSCLVAEAQMTVLYQVSQNDVPIATETWLHKPEKRGGDFNQVHQMLKTRITDKERSVATEQTLESENRWEKVTFTNGDAAILRQHFMKHPTQLEVGEKSIGHFSIEDIKTHQVIDRWPFIVSVTTANRRFWDLTPAMLKARFEIFIPKQEKMVVTEVYDEDEYYFPYSRTVEIYNMVTDKLVTKTTHVRLTGK